MYLHGHNTRRLYISAVHRIYIKSGYDPKNFHGVSIDDLPLVEGIVEQNISFEDFYFQEGEYLGELVRRSRRFGIFEKTL